MELRPASIVLALGATTVVSVGLSSLLFSGLRTPAALEEPSLTPLEGGRLEAAFLQLEARLETLIKVLEGQAMAAPAKTTRRVDAGGTLPSWDPSSMTDLVERLERVGAKLVERTASSAFSSGGAAPIADRTQPTNWAAFGTFFSSAEESTAEKQAESQLLLSSIGEVVALLGRPTHVGSTDRGIFLQYEGLESGRRIDLRLAHGYVTAVDLGFD